MIQYTADSNRTAKVQLVSTHLDVYYVFLMLAQHRKLFEAKNDQVCDAVTLKTLLIIQVLMQKCVKQCSVICFCAWSGAGICEHSKF